MYIMHTIYTTNMKVDTGYDFGTANHFFCMLSLPSDLNNHFNCCSLYFRGAYHFRLNVRIVAKFFFFHLFSIFLLVAPASALSFRLVFSFSACGTFILQTTNFSFSFGTFFFLLRGLAFQPLPSTCLNVKMRREVIRFWGMRKNYIQKHNYEAKLPQFPSAFSGFLFHTFNVLGILVLLLLLLLLFFMWFFSLAFGFFLKKKTFFFCFS